MLKKYSGECEGVGGSKERETHAHTERERERERKVGGEREQCLSIIIFMTDYIYYLQEMNIACCITNSVSCLATISTYAHRLCPLDFDWPSRDPQHCMTHTYMYIILSPYRYYADARRTSGICSI